jgi:hypothetical protein
MPRIISSLIAVVILVAVTLFVISTHQWSNYYDCLNNPHVLGGCTPPSWGGW